MRKTIALFLVMLASVTPAHFTRADDAIREGIAKIVDAPRYKSAHWGMLFVDLETGKTVYERTPDQLCPPASVTKLYSVAAALETLGPDYRFITPVFRRGRLDENGQLDGDLILKASGDLSMGGRTTDDGHIAITNSDHTYANGNETAELTSPDPLAGLNELARQIAASGIKRIRGDVLIDDRLFEKAESTGSGPSRLSPIIINDNLIDIVIEPAGEAGRPARMKIRPESASVRIDAQVDTVAKGQKTEVTLTSPRPGSIIIRGRIAVGHKPLVRVFEVEDAASFARSLFIEALRRAAIRVDASPLDINRGDRLPDAGAYTKKAQVAALTSPPLAESVRLILKVSHNLHASTLPLLLAAHKGKRTLDDGLRLQQEALKRIGIDVAAVSFGGGAGGSRADYTSPRVTVQLLRQMAQRPEFSAYEAGLPILGTDGTLADTVKPDSPARGQVRAKTGTLFWKNRLNDRYLLTSKALAGYMTTSRGRKLAFAIFVNNVSIPTASAASREGKTLGEICEIVYRDY